MTEEEGSSRGVKGKTRHRFAKVGVWMLGHCEPKLTLLRIILLIIQ